MTDHHDPHPLMTFDEAARYLGVTPRFVRKLVAERRLAHRKLGRLIRFTRADLDEFSERSRVGGATSPPAA
jgi:excisionase family DNA binding protein